MTINVKNEVQMTRIAGEEANETDAMGRDGWLGDAKDVSSGLADRRTDGEDEQEREEKAKRRRCRRCRSRGEVVKKTGKTLVGGKSGRLRERADGRRAWFVPKSNHVYFKLSTQLHTPSKQS